MPSADTQVTITEGLPASDPWVISELDTNLKNLALARLAALGANQGKILRTQTAVLNEQVNQLESMSATASNFASGTQTALVMDASNKVLISDPNVVSDLIGRDPSTLTVSDADRLIEFTSNLANSSPAVNLGGRSYVEVTTTVPNTSVLRKLQVPVVEWASDPNNTSADAFEPFVLYTNKSANGTISSVMYVFDGTSKIKVDVKAVSPLPFPDKTRVYDAYKINVGTEANPDYRVLSVRDVFGSMPTQTSTMMLFRDAASGTLHLSVPSGSAPVLDARGFVMPKSQDEMYYWFGQAGAERLQAASTQLVADGIDIGATADAIQWKYSTATVSGGGFAHYPVAEGKLTDTTFPVGSLLGSNGKVYLITGRTGSTNSYVEVTLVGEPFLLKISKENLIKIRGQYTEKITNATQRTTEQQLFLNSLLQKQNYHFDAATNVLKAFGDLQNRLSGLV